MKIVRKKKTQTSPAADPGQPITSPKAPESAKNKTRVLLSVTDGKIDWKALPPEARRQFEELFRNPEFLQQFGITPQKGGFDPETMANLYDAIATMYVTVAKLFMGWPESALAILVYTDDEKKMLAKPTAALANRYAGEFLMKHQALFVWGAVFVSVTQKKFQAGMKEARRVQAVRRPQAIPPMPAPPKVVIDLTRPHPCPVCRKSCTCKGLLQTPPVCHHNATQECSGMEKEARVATDPVLDPRLVAELLENQDADAIA